MKPIEQKDEEREAKRRAMLDAVERLVNEGKSVENACKIAGVTRSQFYKWRGRRRDDPTGGLRDLWRRSPAHPRDISEVEGKQILDLAVKFPGEGCDRLKLRLADEGIARSSTTIQSALNKEGLGTQAQRLARRKQFNLGYRRQLRKLPSRRCKTENDHMYEKIRANKAPGEIVLQSFYSVKAPEHLGQLYLHFIFDCATEWIWFDLSWEIDGKSQDHNAIALLRGGALGAFYAEGVNIRRIATDDRALFTDRDKTLINGAYLSRYQTALEATYIENEVFKVIRWTRNPYLSDLLKRLKAAFPDRDTRARCLEERESCLRTKSD